MRMPGVAIVALIVLLPSSGFGQSQAASPAPSVPEPSSLRLSPWWDGAVVVASSSTIILSSLIPVESKQGWNTQLMPFDSRLEGHYSARASSLSDALLAADVAVPAALIVGQGIHSTMGKQAVIYCETLLLSLALDSLAKPLVGRPRPYTYSNDPVLVEHTRSEGRDAYLSFYSRHAATTFAASVSGAYLFAQSSSDSNARAVVWGAELALAAATADLRTRAGMHFYSDALVGAVVGTAVGLAVPYLHGGPKVRLSKLEWLAIALGPILGIAIGEILPVGG
jgi:membrane-associated phospholipid phosphatase